MYGFGLIEQDEDDWLICLLLSPLLSIIGECPVLSGLLSEQHRYCGALFKTIPCYSIVSQAYRMSVCPSVHLSIYHLPYSVCLFLSVDWVIGWVWQFLFPTSRLFLCNLIHLMISDCGTSHLALHLTIINFIYCCQLICRLTCEW